MSCCPDWEISDDGGTVAYKGRTPFDATYQINVVFASSTKSISISAAGATSLTPRLFSGLDSLDTLFLDRNEFLRVPMLGRAAGALKVLSLSRNNIDLVEVEKMRLVVLLETLDLSHNAIRFLAKDVFEMTRLTELRLQHNQLKGLPQGMFTSNSTPPISLRLSCLPRSVSTRR